MSPHPNSESIQTRDCRVVLRRVEGPEAKEFFLGCQPLAGSADAGAQAESIYSAILEVLDGRGARFGSIVSERLFLKNAQADLESIRSARRRVLGRTDDGSHRPVCTTIEQPPLLESARLEVAIQAVVPREGALRVDVFDADTTCRCLECSGAQGLRVHLGDEVRFQAEGLCGSGENAYEQTLSMFGVAEELLQQAGLAFRDVVRTWIHLREIDRDYAALNRARRAFFGERGIDPVPASTGIGGGPASAEHDVCLGLYAVKAGRPPVRTVMTAPTLNEAMIYGADFVRGMKIEETNKVALQVSGTASIDEAGRTAHPGDFDAQADRMLVNVAALLEGQGATFGDVVSAVTYLKNPADADRLRQKFREAGYEGFPNVLVAAQVCRPELLCETEALAILPIAAPSDSVKTRTT